MVLVLAVVVHVGFRISLGLGQEDVDRYESPLMLSVRRQLVAGPWELYGPFGGSNPLVLIHAPLYYRAAGLLAWTIARAGLRPEDAALIAGRLISAMCLAATMGAAYRLGRLGGLPRRAGWWSALLVAASPILAGQPFAVRPDMAGVALQSWGAVLVLGSRAGPGRRPGWGSLLFGLSACVKQHLVAAWAVSRGARGRGVGARRRLFDSVAMVLLPGLAVTTVIYGTEWMVTAGRIWDAAFVAAANVGRVHPGDWLHVGTVVAAMAGKSAGLAALAAASAVGMRQRSGWTFSVTTLLLVATITALSVVQLVMPVPWVAGTLALAALVALAMALAGCLPPIRLSEGDGPIDAALGTYCMIELILLVILCRSSNGAWINYGIPAVVFATVLVARALVRAVDAMPGIERAIPALAATAMLASALMDAKVESTLRRAGRGDVAQILRSTGLPPSDVFFADRPGLNRMNGRLDWVYDDWLYPVFESLKLAEPRARWLRSLLGTPGTVRAVVLESDGPTGRRHPRAAPGARLRAGGVLRAVPGLDARSSTYGAL